MLLNSDVFKSAVTYQQFKEEASEFFKLVNTGTVSLEGMEAGIKTLMLMYVSLEGTEIEEHQARLAIQLAIKRCNQLQGGLTQ